MVAQARRAGPRRAPAADARAIVDAALVLLERDGLQGLSMRRLAQELGAGAASLYWHVGDKEELLSLLLDRIVGEAQVPEPDPENWQEHGQGARPRDARRLFTQPPRRRAALAGPHPRRPELAAGARAQPGGAGRGRRCRRA